MKQLYLVVLLITGWISVFSQPPVINITPAYRDSFYAIGTNPGPAKSYTVSGTNLTGAISIGGNNFPYSTFEASLTETPFVPAYITLTPVGGTVPPTTVYLRLHSVYLGGIWDGVSISTPGSISWIGATGNALATEPTVPSTLSFGTKTNNSIVVNINGGNGNERILFVKESTAVNAQPYDGRVYAHTGGAYGVTGTEVGSGNYSVYHGPAQTVTVTGLAAGRVYHFAAYEYNTEFGALYPPDPLNYGDFGTQNYLLSGAVGTENTLGGTLPIVINYINGAKQGGKHLLNWKVTCISTPRVTMVLERSADSRNFTAINSITADAVRCNQPFDYTDIDPLKGMNYYRLKMTDADGKVSYSNIVALLNAVKGFDIISIAPNPVVDGNFKLNVASAQAGKMDIAIFDMQGRLVNKQNLSLIAGYNNVPVNITNLSPGSYTIRGSMNDDQAKIIRFVKQ